MRNETITINDYEFRTQVHQMPFEGDNSSIIGAGPVLFQRGIVPRRVVLRFNHGDISPYVVHWQLFPNAPKDWTPEGEYDHGEYCSSYGQAVAAFTERIKQQFGD